MKVTIRPSKACGKIAAPPSKSYAHRALICAALAKGNSKIIGISESEDIAATLDCIKMFGAKVSVEGGVAAVRGIGRHTIAKPFQCRESGSTLRFILPIAAVCGGYSAFYGSDRLIERGIGIYEELFKLYGAKVTKTDKKIMLSGKLSAGKYAFAGNVSSQFATGFLMALPLADGDSEIELLPPVESKMYIDITLSVLESFGIKIEKNGENGFLVKGNSAFVPQEFTVEGDWSNAAFLLALGAEVEGLNENSLQGDKVCREYFAALEGESAVLDISNCPDLGPILFAVAAAKNGALFTGTKRLKIKESDRAQSMADELAKFGVKCEVKDNSVRVYGGISAPSKELCGHNDHRIVMALSYLASIVGGTIDGAEAVSKSYPEFFDVLSSLNIEVENEI